MSEDRERRREQMSESERERERQEEGVVEAGRRGGMAASYAGAIPAERETAIALAMRDLVRWGPIWAGLLIALGIQIVLGAIGLAVALSTYNAAAPNFGARVASFLSIWSVISALIALFIGGFIAGRMAAVLGFRNGLVQGTVVWALAMLLGVLLSALGISGLLSAVNIAPFLTARGAGLTSPEQMALARNAASGAWWFVVGTIVAWIAAAGGGVLGSAAHTEAIEESR